MLFIVMNTTTPYSTEKRDECQWHVGERIPLAADEWENVEFITADCDELDWIRAKFQNIPVCSTRQVTWNGEFARFIMANLEFVR